MNGEAGGGLRYPDSAEEAEDFYEEDEDPAEVFARFEAGEKFVTTRTLT